MLKPSLSLACRYSLVRRASAFLLASMLFFSGCRAETSLETRCARLLAAIEKLSALHLSGNATLDPAAFESSLSQVLSRHNVEPLEVNERATKISGHDQRLHALMTRQCVDTIAAITRAEQDTSPAQLGIELLDFYVRTWDPHSYAISDEETVNRTTFYRGYGFAIERSELGRRIEVTEVIAGSPAHAAGLKQGAVIWAINGVDVREKTAASVSALISQSPQDSVLLGTTFPDQPSAYRETRLKRQSFEVAPVKSRPLLDGRMGYIKIRTLVGSKTPFAEALQTLSTAQSLILDLRDLPGGSIDITQQLADWLTPGRVPFAGLITRGAGVPSTLTLDDPSSFWDRPLIVLVNENTMSAGELLAATLQDHGAVVVGLPTFGKGTRQTYIPLADYGIAGGVHLTDAFTVRPSGAPLQFSGVQPDVSLRFGTAVVVRREQDLREALRPPSGQAPLPGYDDSLLATRNPLFVASLRKLEERLKVAIETGAYGLTLEDQQLEAAKKVAQFLTTQ